MFEITLKTLRTRFEMETPSFKDLYYSPFAALIATPIDKLRRQRKPDTKPKKPQPVTDEQLLGIVDELTGKIEALRKEVAAAKEEAKRGDAAIRRDIEYGYRLRLDAERSANGCEPDRIGTVQAQVCRG